MVLQYYSCPFELLLILTDSEQYIFIHMTRTQFPYIFPYTPSIGISASVSCKIPCTFRVPSSNVTSNILVTENKGQYFMSFLFVFENHSLYGQHLCCERKFPLWNGTSRILYSFCRRQISWGTAPGNSSR